MRRSALWLGFLLVLAGVLLHLPGFLAARSMHFMMAGMAMGVPMTVGMTLIITGVAVAGWSLLPRRSAVVVDPGGGAHRYAALDSARLTRAHWTLFLVLTVGLVVDVMKPASLGFVVPGLAKEYGMSTTAAATLPLVAITGTVLGSLVWGALADLFGRRATILLSALLYVGTAICGFMPSFGWNLVMCFLMGAAAGGMLPTVYSLMSESMPASWRGWLVVLQSGLGTALGYLAAASAAALLIPILSWRGMWLLNAPTGALLLLLNRWIPESPRFLLARGRRAEAEVVMARYGIVALPAGAAGAADPATRRDPAAVGAGAPAGQGGGVTIPGLAARMVALVSGVYRRRTGTVLLYGLAWSVVNWTFITYLPALLSASSGPAAGARVNGLLALSSVFAAPASILAAFAYSRLGSRRAMLTYCGATVLTLLAFIAVRPDRLAASWPLVAVVAVLLASTGGMLAMLSPYAAEIYPTTLRATGSGLAAAATKVGGLLGPLLLASLAGVGPLAIVAVVPVAAAGVALHLAGMETSGRPLLEADPALETDPA
jgi:putative MFS transporter